MKNEVGQITIKYVPDKGFGDAVVVNGVTIMECIGFEDFQEMKVSELVEAYKEMIEIIEEK